MSVLAKPQIRCAACKTPVQANYDHVGDCARGNCLGTFEHPLRGSSAASTTCPWRDRDLRHHHVEIA